MKILVTSGTSAGSWKIRGEQLGSAIGADVINNASLSQQLGYDITICVKKPPKQWQPSGVVVWDMIDFWPQPAGNEWSKPELIAFAAERKEALKASFCVAATQQMRIDTKAELCLYHHSRPGLSIHTGKQSPITTVGYEGRPQYLGRWHGLLLDWCGENNASLLINPDNLAACDVLVALRDHPYRGIATDHWKSNVKLANAQAAGVPIICLPEAGYTETASGTELFISSFEQLYGALDKLQQPFHRKHCSVNMRARSKEFTLEAVAAEYKNWLESLL